MKLFNVAKVGVFLDQVSHGTERRPDGETKVLVLSCRVQPFDHRLAAAVADVVRQDLFKLNHPDPKQHLRRVDFSLGVPRQQMHIFASPDTTNARLMFDQVKISATYARTEANVNGFAFCFKATLGPPSKSELEFAEDWRLGQRFVTFETAEPGLFEEDEELPADEAVRREPEMWDDGDEQNPNIAAAERAADHEQADRALDDVEEPQPARRTAPRHASRRAAARAKKSAGAEA